MLARLTFWLLLPVTALQGLWLRRRATRLPGAEGERSGATGEGEDFHLLALGDSIIDAAGIYRTCCTASTNPGTPPKPTSC